MTKKACKTIIDTSKIICTKCKITLTINYLGKRCPRCNAVLRIEKCGNCTGCLT